MSPWEVIEGAMARRRPQRDQAWLAVQLGIGEQAITNWKTRGVPKGRYLEIADLLGLTVKQVAGQEPPPWANEKGNWPFPDIDPARWMALNDYQRGEVQGEVRKLVERFEAQRSLGKFNPSQNGANRRSNGN